LWQGQGDLALQPLDAVTVFSQARFPHSVTLEGEVVRPGTYSAAPGERLSEVLTRAGGVTPGGWLPAAVFTRRSAAEQSRQVRGSVMNPGTLAARRRGSFSDYVALAGGVSREADLGRGYVLRSNGEAQPRRDAHWIEPGDAIVVPPRESTPGGLGHGLASGS